MDPVSYLALLDPLLHFTSMEPWGEITYLLEIWPRSRSIISSVIHGNNGTEILQQHPLFYSTVVGDLFLINCIMKPGSYQRRYTTLMITIYLFHGVLTVYTAVLKGAKKIKVHTIQKSLKTLTVQSKRKIKQKEIHHLSSRVNVGERKHHK